MPFKRITIILLACFLVMANTTTEETDLILARLYFERVGTQESAVSNLKILTEGKQAKPIYKAYLGAAYCAEAKYRWNPYSKLERVKTGMGLLNQAVISESSNIEIRFLRFCIEENLPSTLPYKQHIEIDKLFILANIKKEHTYYATMKAYLLKSESLSESERKQL
jgi:hypothetical protein